MRLLLLLALCVSPLFAQLPVARLNRVVPAGAQIGSPRDVVIEGSDIDESSALLFTHPGISAVKKTENTFTVAVATNVPPGIYEVHFVGRFGATNPRAFVVSDLPESLNSGTNKTLAAAQEFPFNTVINGMSPGAGAWFYKFKATAGQRILFECQTREIDSRMEPVLTLFTPAGKELARDRASGLLDFTSKADQDVILKIHDLQFRGIDDFRLCARVTPWIDFTLPAALEPGQKSMVTLFGRNLPNGKKSRFEGLDELEVEITGPKEAASSYLSRIPAAAAVDAFEYRFQNSNPVLISLATAQPILEGAPITVPCEVQGQFFPARNVDSYQFDLAKGEVAWVEVFSHRLGMNTDPFLVAHRVTKNDKGEEQLVDTQEAYDNDTNIGGPEFNTTTRDPALRLESKDGGTYRVQVRDLFNQSVADSHRIYRLSIRKETPDFRLIAFAPAPPPLNKDSKELHPWGAFLRRGDSVPVKILVLRRDNFSGEIEVSAEGLPTGVTASPLTIPSGANSAMLILSATEEAASWAGSVRIVGKSKDLRRVARSAAIGWSVGDYNNERVFGNLTQELMLSVSGKELAPLALAPEKTVDAAVGSKATLPIKIARRHEFNGAVKFRTLIEPAKEFEVDGKATNATFEIDLNQIKLPAGAHRIPLYATVPGRYRRITPEEAKATEEEIKKLKESLPAVAEAPKKDEINNRIKALEPRLQYRDVTATFYGFAEINVTNAPAAVSK